jgi:hypothetical protein
VIETRGHEHADQVVQGMRNAGYETRVLH